MIYFGNAKLLGYCEKDTILLKTLHFILKPSFKYTIFFYFDHFYKIQCLHLLLYVVFTYKWMFHRFLFSWQELTHTWVDKPRKVLLGMGCLRQYSCDYWINIYEDVISIYILIYDSSITSDVGWMIAIVLLAAIYTQCLLSGPLRFSVVRCHLTSIEIPIIKISLSL